jgi:hypothetical protein
LLPQRKPKHKKKEQQTKESMGASFPLITYQIVSVSNIIEKFPTEASQTSLGIFELPLERLSTLM